MVNGFIMVYTPTDWRIYTWPMGFQWFLVVFTPTNCWLYGAWNELVHGFIYQRHITEKLHLLQIGRPDAKEIPNICHHAIEKTAKGRRKTRGATWTKRSRTRPCNIRSWNFGITVYNSICKCVYIYIYTYYIYHSIVFRIWKVQECARCILMYIVCKNMQE